MFSLLFEPERSNTNRERDNIDLVVDHVVDRRRGRTGVGYRCFNTTLLYWVFFIIFAN